MQEQTNQARIRITVAILFAVAAAFYIGFIVLTAMR